MYICLSLYLLRHQNVDILINIYCNDRMKFKDGSCCSAPESITLIQMGAFLFFGSCILLACIIVFFQWLCHKTNEIQCEY